MGDRPSYSLDDRSSSLKRGRLRPLSRALRSPSAFDSLLWAFILTGMVLRLLSLHAMEFKEDEFAHLLGALKAGADPWSAPLLSGEGTNPSPGVFFYQFLAIPVSFTRDPVSVAAFIASVNIVAIPALFLLVRRFFTPRVALSTTALLATAPWMIVFSRKIWNPDLIVPFLIVCLSLLFSAMVRYAPWKVYAFAFSLALLTQLHLSVWFALLPLLPLGLLFRPWRRPLDLAVGVSIFFAVILFTLGSNTGEFVARFAGASAQPSDLGLDLPHLVAYNASWSVRVPSGFGFGFLLGPSGYPLFEEHAVVPWTRPIFALHVALVGAGAVVALCILVKAARGSFREASDRFLLTLILMACSLHAFYLVFRVAAHPHYHVVLSLLPPLLVSLFLAWMSTRFRIGSIVAPTLLVIVLAANVSFGYSFLTFVRMDPEAIDGDYGRPYFVEQQRWVRRLAEESLDGPKVPKGAQP